MLTRVSAEDFKTLSSKAKKIGGYYSRYTDRNANPPIKAGFNFKTEEEARAFIGLKEQDQNTTEQAQEKAEEVKQIAIHPWTNKNGHEHKPLFINKSNIYNMI